MAVNNTQYLSFLGGLVSPRLWLRSDMDKFGKWFATADNIRFHTVGSFENRFGTIKIGNTKNNLKNENIKLVKFDFGQGETCMLELGNNYFRVISNGEYIMDATDPDNIVPKVFETNMVLDSQDDIKYVQSGDILFLTNKNGIYEIKRLSKDFTQWETTSFGFNKDIVPYGDENDDDFSIISIAKTQSVKNTDFTVNIPQREDSVSGYLNPVIDIEINTGGIITRTNVYTGSGDISANDLQTALNTSLSTYDISATIENNLLTFDTADANVDVENFYFSFICYKRYSSAAISAGDTFAMSSSQKMYGVNVQKASSGFVDSFELKVLDTPYPTGLSNSISAFNSKYNNGTKKYKLVQSGTDSFKAQGQFNVLGGYEDIKYIVEYINPDEVNITADKHSSASDSSYYTATTAKDFFGDKEIGETFMVRNEVGADYIHATKTGYSTAAESTETSVPPTMISNGFWRYNSSGLWSGEVMLQYSTNDGVSWTTFFNRKNSSYSNYSTTNDNTSGNIKTDGGTVLLRMVVSNIAEDNASKFSAELAVDKFEINSVYRVYSKANNKSAVVECVKGDIGEFTNNSRWREAEFSKASGYPTSIGFYQNRLFLGKEYKLYSSRINDFWDFYEPIEVADDDPMIISLLSYKVNTIQNIIGIRSFFAFTTGGEFGIGGEGGAFTQASKFLKQISAHGSNSCNPIFCGDIIVFVDKTNNTVRAFRYSLESDGWEATDVSVLIEQILEGKKIITTEYMQDTKECLFLTDEGEVYVFKFFQEQNIAAWSVWKHAKYKITNLCVLEDELGKNILYIALNNTDTNGMQIERFDSNFYYDSTEEFDNILGQDSVSTDFKKGDKVVVYALLPVYSEEDPTEIVDTIPETYLAEVGENGVVSLRNDSTYAAVGLSYTSTATLLSPEIQDRDGTFSTFNRKRPFKVYCFYRDSYGFKVGVEEENKQEIQFQPVWSDVDSETDLTTGKASVLIPARYDGSSRVSFVQEKPYPMIIENILLETDYGGK